MSRSIVRPEDDVRLRLAQEAALTGSRPTVMVHAAWSLDGDDPDALFELVCTACGELSDLTTDRHELQRLAWRHAEDVHDGDVEREGWV